MADPTQCLHEEDGEDHKCTEACADAAFAMKGVTVDGPCPDTYSTVDSTKVVLQCPDGVTNLRYCPETALNVTVAIKGTEEEEESVVTLLLGSADPQQCLHEEDGEDHKCTEACADAAFAMKGVTVDGPCPDTYSTVDSTKVVLQCPDGVTNLRYCPETALNVTV